jgi:exosortase E/protease (VPEID-CTERM system)
LLLIELLALTLRFESPRIEGPGRWWAELLEHSGFLLQIAMTMAVALLVFAGDSLRRGLEAVTRQLENPHPWWPFLVAHLATFGLFVWLTSQVMEGDLASSPTPEAWVIAWGLGGAATLALLIAAALPPASWWPLLQPRAGALVAAALVGVAAWTASRWSDLLWTPLAAASFAVSEGLLQLLFPDVVSLPDRLILGTPGFRVIISPACSGYEGIGLVAVFLSVYLWVFRRELRFPVALVIVPLGVVVVWLANAVRIAALIALGSWGARELAAGGFHSLAGWLAFNFVVLGLIAVSRRLAGRQRVATRPTATAAYVLPLLVVIGTGMLTGALSSGFDRWYPLRVVTGTAAACCFWRTYARLRWGWSGSAVGVGLVVFGIWLALEPSTEDSGRALADAVADLPRGWAITWLAFRVVGSTLLVPLVEELAFRGYLTRRLLAADFEAVPAGTFSWFSMLVSSALFAALHPGRFVAAFLAGLLFAMVYYQRGRVSDAVVAHATANGLIAGYVLSTGSWGLWS